MYKNSFETCQIFVAISVCAAAYFGHPRLAAAPGLEFERPSAVSRSHATVTEDVVHPLFDFTAPFSAPFPSDRFTVPDGEQITGRRVNLPLPDCSTRPSDCEDAAVINSLDGFNVSPRLSIPWDGAIDVATVTSRTVFLIPLYGDRPAYRIVGIDLVVWNPERKRLFAKSEDMLDQHSRYALIVTNGIRAANGMPVAASDAFQKAKNGGEGDAADVSEALRAARQVGVAADSVVAATVFTTQTVTAVLEKIRDQIKAATPGAARFDLGPGGMRTVFPLNSIASAVWNQQTNVSPDKFVAVRLNFPALASVVGKIAFGKYTSPDYRVHPGEFIPAVGSLTGTPKVQSINDIYFDLFLPSGAKPANGWPVAIWGHGSGGNKTVNSLFIAGTLAAHGIATIAINAAGQGFGAGGTLALTMANGETITFPSGGRGADQNGDGVISDGEGMSTAPPYRIIDDRDGFQQTVADLVQLVRVLQAGIEVDDNPVATLDPNRIYYVGQSLGAMYGTLFLAVEPDVLIATLTAPGGPRTNRRLNTVGARTGYGNWLASRTPPLVNSPGITHIEGVSVASAPLFNENLPLPHGLPLAVVLEDGSSKYVQSPVIDDVSGAFDIQEFLENTEWVMQMANPVAYAQHLEQAPLAGVRAKSVLFQFAKGDQFVPNPATTALLRAGRLEGRATFYRHDLASAENPALPKPGHGFMVNAAGFGVISLGAQEQIAEFLASDGTRLIHPEPLRFFEVPVIPPLPEDLGFVR